MNDRLGLTLAVFATVAAVPVASNRSTWWLLWTGLLMAVAIHQLWRKQAADPNYRPRFLRYRWSFLLALAVPAFALFQSLPIAGLLPGFLTRLREGMEGFSLHTVSVLPGGGAIGALRFVGYIVFFALLVEATARRERAARMAAIIFAGVVAQALWALVALRLLDDYAFWGKTDYLGSATGTFVNRNSLATFLGMGLVLGLGLAAHLGDRPRGRVSRATTWIDRLGLEGLFIGLGLAIILLALLATNSRMGLVATLAGAFATLALLRSAAGASIGRVAAEFGALLAIVLALLVLTAEGQGLMDRLFDVQGDAVNRLAIYQQTLELIRLRPLSGFGFDAFGAAFEAVRQPPLLQNVYYDLAHNSYLGLWSETGLIVGSIPPVLLAIAGWHLLAARRATGGYGGLASAGLGVLVLGAVHSLFDFSLEMPANVYLLLAIIALGLGRNARSTSALADRSGALAEKPAPEAPARPAVTPVPAALRSPEAVTLRVQMPARQGKPDTVIRVGPGKRTAPEGDTPEDDRER